MRAICNVYHRKITIILISLWLVSFGLGLLITSLITCFALVMSFFFFPWSNVIIIYLFIYLINFLDKFFLKIWISRNVPYFVDILNEIGEIFLPGCSQVFFQLNIRFRGIFEPHKSPIQSGESSYQYKRVLRCSFFFFFG